MSVWHLTDKRQMMSLAENYSLLGCSLSLRGCVYPKFDAFDVKRRDSSKMLFISIFQKGQECVIG